MTGRRRRWRTRYLSASSHVLQKLAELVGREIKRTDPAFVDDPTLSIDDVDALRPGGVAGHGGVAEVVDESLGLDPHPIDQRPREIGAGLESLGLVEDHLRLHVGIHLPLVPGVGFFDVHQDQLDLVLEVLMYFLELGQPGSKRRSGVAAEDQDQRLLAIEIGDLLGTGAVGGGKLEVGSEIPHRQGALGADVVLVVADPGPLQRLVVAPGTDGCDYDYRSRDLEPFSLLHRGVPSGVRAVPACLRTKAPSVVLPTCFWSRTTTLPRRRTVSGTPVTSVPS